MKLIFCLLTNVEDFFKLILPFYDHESVKDMVMGMIKHSQSTQSNKFAMSLKYL